MNRIFLFAALTAILTLSPIPGFSQKTASITATGSSLTATQATDALSFHNKIRAELGIAPLEWSADLSAIAQKWADHLAASGCNMQHSHTGTYGENLYWSSIYTQEAVTDACASWYEEKQYFKNVPLTNSNWAKQGHYTQMIWRNTQQVGMGIAKCKDGAVIVVANYKAPGNYLGQKAY